MTPVSGDTATILSVEVDITSPQSLPSTSIGKITGILTLIINFAGLHSEATATSVVSSSVYTTFPSTTTTSPVPSPPELPPPGKRCTMLVYQHSTLIWVCVCACNEVYAIRGHQGDSNGYVGLTLAISVAGQSQNMISQLQYNSTCRYRCTRDIIH